MWATQHASPFGQKKTLTNDTERERERKRKRVEEWKKKEISIIKSTSKAAHEKKGTAVGGNERVADKKISKTKEG